MLQRKKIHHSKFLDDVSAILSEGFPDQRHSSDFRKMKACGFPKDMYIIERLVENKLGGFLLAKTQEIFISSNYLLSMSIGFVAVSKQHQNNGFASEMLNEASKLAAELGVKCIYLQGINGFYEKFGYVPQLAKSKIVFQNLSKYSKRAENKIRFENATFSDVETISNIYSEYSNNITCAAKRTEESWSWLLNTAKNTMFFDNPTVVFY